VVKRFITEIEETTNDDEEEVKTIDTTGNDTIAFVCLTNPFLSKGVFSFNYCKRLIIIRTVKHTL